jgi:hypothetical protein
MVVPLGILDEADFARSPAYKPTCHIFSATKCKRAGLEAGLDSDLYDRKVFIHEHEQEKARMK